MRMNMNTVRQTTLPYYNFFFYALAAGSVLVSIALDISTHRRYTLFERSGAILVFCGTFLSFRHQFRRGLIGLEQEDAAIDSIPSPPHTGEKSEREKEEQEEKRDLVSLYNGTMLAGLGTVIWGYGDLFLSV